MAEAIITSCHKTLQSVNEFRATVRETWIDCDRLCERMSLFQDIIVNKQANPELLSRTKREFDVLAHLDKVLRQSLHFMTAHTTRSSFKGFTDLALRENYMMDLAKNNLLVAKLTKELSLADDIDYEKIREEDYLDTRGSYQYAVRTIVAEIFAPENETYEDDYAKLRKDIKQYEDVVAKSLAMLKHIPLTILESRALRKERKHFVEYIDGKYKERCTGMKCMVAESIAIEPVASISCYSSRSDCISTELDSFDEVNINPTEPLVGSNEEDYLSEVILGQNNLSEDRLNQRQQLIEKLCLPAQDVIISTFRLGQGGFGEVFLGQYHKKQVAIKKLYNNEGHNSLIHRKRLENELLLLKYFNAHPKIVNCFGYIFDKSSQHMQIVLELAPYGSLDLVLQDRQRFPSFPVGLPIAWLCDLADALECLHAKGIKHNDIKAENALVFNRFHLKLCDFSSAKQQLLLEEDKSAESEVRALLYMAPEVRIGAASALSSDIFSWAMTAVQILTRTIPRIDDFQLQVSQAVEEANFPGAEVNSRLHGLLQACVLYDPEVHPDRLRPSAVEVLRAMQELIDCVGGDPRETVEHQTWMDELETMAKDKFQTRLMVNTNVNYSNNSNVSPHPFFGVERIPSTLSQYGGLSSPSGSESNSLPPSPAISPQIRVNPFNSRPSSQAVKGHYPIPPPIDTFQTFHTIPSMQSVHGDSRSPSTTISHQTQEMEDRAALLRFLSNDVQCSQVNAMRCTDILVKNGVLTVDILRRRLMRDPELLLNLGIDEEVAEDIAGVILKQMTEERNVNVWPNSPSSVYSRTKSMKTIKSMKSMKSMSSMKSGSGFGATGSMVRGKSFRRAVSFMTLGLNPDILPTEISRLYYEASQCHKLASLQRLEEIAEEGDNLAQGFLMRMHALGLGIPKNRELAEELGMQLLPWMREMLEGGNELYSMFARYLIGVCYSEGLGTELDHREALRWYKLSAEQQYAPAQAYVGYCYFAGVGVSKNFTEAYRWYLLSAEQGYAGAQSNLGLLYEHGLGVGRNAFEAVHWYKAAAEQGDAAAEFNMGYCYENGIGCLCDALLATKYYRRSADKGFVRAQYSLGMCYYSGCGVRQDLSLAVHWYRIAAEQGNYAAAQCKLGLCFESGHGVEKDVNEAVVWYRRSADQMHPPALYYLGFCYFTGLGVDKQHEEAVRLYTLSAEKQYAAAQNNLGFCFFHGFGVTKHLPSAVKWYRLAAEQGYAAAQYNLAYCYEKGLGVVSKLNEVIKWYRLASDNGNEKAKKALARLHA